MKLKYSIHNIKNFKDAFQLKRKRNGLRLYDVMFTDDKEKATDSILLFGRSFYFSMTQFPASSSEKVLGTKIPTN